MVTFVELTILFSGVWFGQLFLSLLFISVDPSSLQSDSLGGTSAKQEFQCLVILCN